MKRLPKVCQLTADSIVQAISRAQDWMKANTKSEHHCWFRGVKDATLSLLPGAYWRKGYNEFETLVQFSQEGRAFVDMGELDDWRTYYLAQHHGVPTRLLDWTENFVTALFFAVDGWRGDTLPCVWIILPAKINGLSMNWEGLISPERYKELKAWMPTSIRDGRKRVSSDDGDWVYDSAYPLALYPRKNNARMIAQQGTFTVHGTDRDPLDAWIMKCAPTSHQEILCKVVFSRKLKVQVAVSELADLGVRRSTIYPDLQNFVLELRDRNGWA